MKACLFAQCVAHALPVGRRRLRLPQLGQALCALRLPGSMHCLNGATCDLSAVQCLATFLPRLATYTLCLASSVPA